MPGEPDKPIDIALLKTIRNLESVLKARDLHNAAKALHQIRRELVEILISGEVNERMKEVE